MSSIARRAPLETLLVIILVLYIGTDAYQEHERSQMSRELLNLVLERCVIDHADLDRLNQIAIELLARDPKPELTGR